MQLWFQTWHEVERYLAHSDGIIVPIGSRSSMGRTA
jgi:hypothetical protein